MALSGKRILLVIGGGIAAYKSLDLIRRLRERGASVRCILTAGAQEFVTPLAASSLSRTTQPHGPVRSAGRGGYRPHPARPRCRPDRRRPGDRQPHGQDGGRACGRSRNDGAARHHPADPDSARHERPHVAAPGDAAKPRERCWMTASTGSVPTTARWRRRNSAPAAWRSLWKSPTRPNACWP